VATSHTTDEGDYTRTITGEPAWDNPTAWLTVTLTPKAGTPAANADTIAGQARTALATNRTFLALGAPTNAQTLAQVQALTRQVTGLARLVLGQLDGTN